MGVVRLGEIPVPCRSAGAVCPVSRADVQLVAPDFAYAGEDDKRHPCEMPEWLVRTLLFLRVDFPESGDGEGRRTGRNPDARDGARKAATFRRCASCRDGQHLLLDEPFCLAAETGSPAQSGVPGRQESRGSGIRHQELSISPAWVGLQPQVWIIQ